MLKKDKIKIVVIIVLLSAITTTYFIEGKESIIMKYVAGSCLIIWLGTMFITSKKYK